MQQAPKLSMEQRVGALDRFYKLPDGTSQRLESLAVIIVIKGIENDIKKLKAKEALAMSIKKVNQVAETMKTHKTDRINKCKDSNKFNIQISGPRTCSKYKICGKLFTQRKTLNKHYKVKYEATNSLDQSELIKLKPLDLQLSDYQVKSKRVDLQTQPRSINIKVREDITKSSTSTPSARTSPTSRPCSSPPTPRLRRKSSASTCRPCGNSPALLQRPGQSTLLPSPCQPALLQRLRRPALQPSLPA